MWLRDPIERIRSHFDSWRLGSKRVHPRAQDLFDSVHAGTCSIEQFGTHPTVANYYRWILGDIDVHELTAVGVLEKADASLARITTVLGLSPSGELPSLNQTKGRNDRPALSPTARTMITDANAADFEIYDQAVARYQAVVG